MNLSANQVHNNKPAPLLERIKRFGTKGLDYARITLDDMCQGDGTSCFHMFAKLGAVGELPAAWITPKFLVEFRDEDGNAPIHIAAEWGKLASFPLHLKSREHLLTRGKNEYTVFHFAAFSGSLDTIPSSLITHSDMLLKSKVKKTPLHGAAACGQLNLVPQSLLTQECLFMRDSFRETPFYLAAEHGHLGQVPQALLTIENLTDRGFTHNSLGAAILANKLDKVPIFRENHVCLMTQDARDEWRVALEEASETLKSANALSVIETLSKDWSHIATRDWASL